MSTPYDYYPAVLYAIDKISQGMSKTQACDKANINIPTFEKYVKEDQQLTMLLVDAERRGYDALADALLQPGNHLLYGETNPQMAKVMSDNIKWLLSKRRPKEFGDRIEIKHEISLDRAITDAMDAARQRATSRTLELSPTDYVQLPAPIITEVVSNIVDVLTDDDELLDELLS